MTQRDWPRAILFDLDGTLADSLPDIAEALNHLLSEKGWGRFSDDEVRLMVGGGVPKLIERTLRRLGMPVPDGGIGPLAARFLEIYAPRAAKLTTLFPGARALLEALHAQGVRLGVCTNKPEAVTRQMLDTLGVSHLLGAIIGGDTVATKKPDPAPVFAALERLGCGPQGALMVGDSPADAGAARAAGIPVILVSFGYTRTPVREIDADGIIDSFADLPKALERFSFPAHSS